MTLRALPALLLLVALGGAVSPGVAPAAEMPAAETPAAETPAAEVDEAAQATDEAAGGTSGDEASGDFLSFVETDDHPQASFSGLMLRLVFSMAVVLGLIYGALMLFRLLARKAKTAPKSEKLIRIIDRAALDPKRAVYLVKVVDRLLVIGVGTNEVRTLAQIDDETVVDSVQETEFTGHLQSLLGRLAGRQS